MARGIEVEEKFSWRTYLPALFVAGLGFLVDVYDVLLFAILRLPSLRDLGVTEHQMLHVGVWLMNVQMVGLLLGGVVWGWIGDKKGRKAALFGSILCYSLATLANAFVTDVSMYACLRFIAGFGLAGEVGAAMTMIAEITPPLYRTYGTAAVSLMGVAGSLLASYVGGTVPWRMAFFGAAVAGFCLLFLRVSMKESPLFAKLKEEGGRAGIGRDISTLLLRPRQLMKLASCVLSALPLFFVFAIIVTFAPEIKPDISSATIVAKIALLYSVGEILGEAVSGVLSQWMRSRRKVILLFQVCGAGLVTMFFNTNAEQYVMLCLPLGFFVGFWAIVITSTAEQFGTNVRSTATTLVPNLMRACNIPLNVTFALISAKTGTENAMMLLAAASYCIGMLSTLSMPETFGKDLDFIET